MNFRPFNLKFEIVPIINISQLKICSAQKNLSIFNITAKLQTPFLEEIKIVIEHDGVFFGSSYGHIDEWLQERQNCIVRSAFMAKSRKVRYFPSWMITLDDDIFLQALVFAKDATWNMLKNQKSKLCARCLIIHTRCITSFCRRFSCVGFL